MRLAVAGLMPDRLEQIDAQVAREIAELGFSAVSIHLVGDPKLVSEQTCQQARSVLADSNIRIIQFWGWYASIISQDDSIRRSGIATAQELIRIAEHLGCLSVGIRPTSRNPDGDWWPHPENYEVDTEAHLVQSLREIASACSMHGVPIALECHTASTLNSARTVRRVIENINSPWVKVNLDPVNFIADLHTAYHTTELINELFEELGMYVATLHVKDVYVESRHVVHISETIPGDGILDFDTLFKRFENVLPEGYAIIEHLPKAQVPKAKAFVERKLQELNITPLMSSSDS